MHLKSNLTLNLKFNWQNLCMRSYGPYTNMAAEKIWRSYQKDSKLKEFHKCSTNHFLVPCLPTLSNSHSILAHSPHWNQYIPSFKPLYLLQTIILIKQYVRAAILAITLQFFLLVKLGLCPLAHLSAMIISLVTKSGFNCFCTEFIYPY